MPKTAAMYSDSSARNSDKIQSEWACWTTPVSSIERLDYLITIVDRLSTYRECIRTLSSDGVSNKGFVDAGSEM